MPIRRLLPLAAILAALIFTTARPVPANAAPDEAIPDSARMGIEEVLKKKVADLADEKNAEGFPYKRGAYSKNFRKVDESTYAVTFHRDTADKEVLKTERLLLTVKKDASGKWAIAKEEVQDTYDGLRRTDRANDEFYRFDKLTLDREGLKVTATNGSFVQLYFQGKPAALVLVATDLAYEYAPPSDLGYYQMYRRVVLEEYKEDFVFKPVAVSIQCDAVSCQDILTGSFQGIRKVAKGDLAADLQRIYDDGMRAYTEELKNNGFFGFVLPPEADRRTWSIGIHKNWATWLKRDYLKDHYIWLGKDSYDGWDMNFGCSDYGPLYGYYSKELLATNPSPKDLEARDDLDSRDHEVDSVVGTAEMALEDAEALKGDVTFGLTMKRDLKTLPFFIYRLRDPGSAEKQAKNPKLFISSIRDGDGNELTWVKTGPYSGLVVFPKPVAGGSKLSLRMQFTNFDSIYKVNPSFSAVDRLGWLPFVLFTDPIEKFDLTVKAPAKYTTIGPGHKVSETKEGNVLVTRWTSASPISFPTVIFGDYITDKATIKATKKDGTEIPVNVWVDKVSTQAMDSQESVDGGARQIRQKSLSVKGDEAVNALNLYKTVFDQDYPFEKLDLVADPMGSFYGQAPASIIYLGFGTFWAEGTVGTLGGSDLSKFNKDVVPHETGHQWWGSLIGNSNQRNYWFIESITEYAAAVFVENVRGRQAYLDKVADWRRTILNFESLTSVQNASALWGGESPGASYIANVYNKGPYAFHVLRTTFGDEKFFAFLKKLAAEFKGKRIVTSDIQRVSEQAFGGNMDWFWNQWIRRPGLPEFAVSWQTRPTEDGKYLLEGKVRQRTVVGKKNIEIPETYFKARGFLTLIFADGKEMKWPQPAKPGEAERLWIVDGAETPFKIKLPQAPVDVKFINEGEILAENVRYNTSW